MRLREWVRARRITTPSPVLPLVGLGLLAIAVSWAVFGALAGIVLLVEVIVDDPSGAEDSGPVRVALGALLQVGIAVLGCFVLRRLVAGWVRRQPPDPPRGPMTG